MSDQQEEIFVDVSKENSSNLVWNYFLRGTKNQVAKCIQCKQILKILGGCTTPMHTHLRAKHNKILNKRKIDNDSSVAGASAVNLNRKSKTLKDFYNSKVDESFAAVISRMVASDGLSFRVFCTSDDLRKCLRMRGFDVPKSPTSIQKVVMSFSEKIRQSIIVEIISQKKKKGFFSEPAFYEC